MHHKHGSSELAIGADYVLLKNIYKGVLHRLCVSI